MDNIEDLRKSLDNIDNALIYLLTERFRLTHRVGIYKRDNHLPPVDKSREEQQFKRLASLAKQQGLSGEVAIKLFRQIIDLVVEEHTRLQNQDQSKT